MVHNEQGTYMDAMRWPLSHDRDIDIALESYCCCLAEGKCATHNTNVSSCSIVGIGWQWCKKILIEGEERGTNFCTPRSKVCVEEI